MDDNQEKQSKLIGALDTFGNLFILNVVFILCCLPVVTIGASFTAMYSVTLKMVRKEEGAVVRSFFAAFKENFKNSTIVWLLVVLLGAIIAGEWIFANTTEGAFAYIYYFVVVIELVVLFVGLPFVFPLLARYDSGIIQTIKNSFLLAISNLGSWLKFTLAWVTPVVLYLYFIDTLFVLSWYMWVIIFFALIAFCSSFTLRKLFDKISNTQSENEEKKAEEEKKKQEEKAEHSKQVKEKMKRFENPEK